MGRLETVKGKSSFPILTEHVGLFDLLERAKEMSKNMNPEFRFAEERHNNISGYENAIIDGEKDSARPRLVGGTGTDS